MTKGRKDRVALIMMVGYSIVSVALLVWPVIQDKPAETLKEYKDYQLPFFLAIMPAILIAAASFFFGKENVPGTIAKDDDAGKEARIKQLPKDKSQ